MHICVDYDGVVSSRCPTARSRRLSDNSTSGRLEQDYQRQDRACSGEDEARVKCQSLLYAGKYDSMMVVREQMIGIVVPQRIRPWGALCNVLHRLLTWSPVLC